MPGRNRYYDVESEYRNLHEVFKKRGFGKATNFSMGTAQSAKPCIFLSHRSTDKDAVKEIGEYIKSKDIDVFLDIDDANLQRAVQTGDHKAVTAAIELGIANSTDLLAYVTNSTKQSPWVPYEIGFAKRDGSHLAIMRAKDVSDVPSYLMIVPQITGIESLDAHLKAVNERDRTKTDTQKMISMLRFLSEGSGPTHPLSRYLAQK